MNSELHTLAAFPRERIPVRIEYGAGLAGLFEEEKNLLRMSGFESLVVQPNCPAVNPLLLATDLVRLLVLCIGLIV
jgi:hypothetical protein